MYHNVDTCIVQAPFANTNEKSNMSPVKCHCFISEIANKGQVSMQQKQMFLLGTFFPWIWQLVSAVYAHLTQDQSGFVREVSHVEMTSGPHVVSLTWTRSDGRCSDKKAAWKKLTIHFQVSGRMAIGCNLLNLPMKLLQVQCNYCNWLRLSILRFLTASSFTYQPYAISAILLVHKPVYICQSESTQRW